MSTKKNAKKSRLMPSISSAHAGPVAHAVHPIVRRVGRASHIHVTALAQEDGHDLSSSFGSDNLHHFADWFLLMQAKLVSGAVTAISLVVREFVHDRPWVPKVVDGKTIHIPWKRICGCSISYEGGVRMLTAAEIDEAHNQCATTGRRLLSEPGVEFIDFARWLDME
jgi:hypothetical protein